MSPVVWQVEVRWRELPGELVAAGSVTVMTINDTCRLLDSHPGQPVSYPTAHQLHGDRTSQLMADVVDCPHRCRNTLSCPVDGGGYR